MGGKSSKPVTGENGVITYKVDIFGGNIRQKFDSGDLQISEEQLTFTGAKATFKWPIKELKRYGSAKKVFTIEINEHNAELDSREIKFKTKYADNIYEQFKNKIGEMEGESKPEGAEEKKAPADAANAVTDDAKAAEPEKNGSVQKASDKEDAKTDNNDKGKETGEDNVQSKTTPNAAEMTLTTNPTITVQTPSPTTERPDSDPASPAEPAKEEPAQTQETTEEKPESVTAAEEEGKAEETAASTEEQPSESPQQDTAEKTESEEAAPAETSEPEPANEAETSENQENTANQDATPEQEAETVPSEEPAPETVNETAEEPAENVENHTAPESDNQDAEITCSEEAATPAANHEEETPADPVEDEAQPAEEAEAPAAENGPSESQEAE